LELWCAWAGKPLMLQKPTRRDDGDFGTGTGSPNGDEGEGKDWAAGVNVCGWKEGVPRDSPPVKDEGDGETGEEEGKTVGTVGFPVVMRELVPPTRGATAHARGGGDSRG